MSLKSFFALFCLVGLLGSCSPVQFTTQKDDQGGNENCTGPKCNPTPPPPPGQIRDVEYNGSIKEVTQKVDILLVIDDSNSMLTNNTKLGAKLSNFVTELQNSTLDWQMCTTITRAKRISDDGTTAWGASIIWQNYAPAPNVPKYVLKPGTSNLDLIFNSTIQTIGAGWANSDDERGIKSAYWHFYQGDPFYSNPSGCYRQDSALAVILISNEDVRSIGGNKLYQYYSHEYYPLETDDLPATLMEQVKTIFGKDKRFTYNSIIVKPNDKTCMASQDAQGTKSHEGIHYAQLSEMSGGGIGSICDNDFSNNIKYFKDKIENSLGSIPLECVPIETPKVILNPEEPNIVWSVSGASIVFTPVLKGPHTIKINYKCNASSSFAQNGSPERIPASQNPESGIWGLIQGIWQKIIHFFN